MKETSPDEPYIDRLRTWAKTKVHGGNRSSAARRPGERDDLPLSNSADLGTTHSTAQSSSVLAQDITPIDTDNGDSTRNNHGGPAGDLKNSILTGPNNSGSTEGGTQPTPSPQASRKGSQLGTDVTSSSLNPSTNEKVTDENADSQKANVAKRFLSTSRKILFHSWLNVLLVFVPVGIAVNFVPNMPPAVIFSLNAIAIIPLAGLLSHATETVAHRMGDAIGALLNITFGNAVELIILYVSHRNVSNSRMCPTDRHLACMFAPCQIVIKDKKEREAFYRAGALSNQSRPISSSDPYFLTIVVYILALLCSAQLCSPFLHKSESIYSKSLYDTF